MESVVNTHETFLFEDAIVKIQRGEALAENQARLMSKFQVEIIAEDNDDQISLPEERVSVLSRQKRRKLELSKQTYRSVLHVIPTSNVVERLFSKAKLVFSDRRKSLTISRLQQILHLLSNKDHWNIRTVEKCPKTRTETPAVALTNESDDDSDGEDLYCSRNANVDDTKSVQQHENEVEPTLPYDYSDFSELLSP